VLQDCPPGSTDFREYQCSQFNGKHFNIHGLTNNVKWVAKYSGSKSQRLSIAHETMWHCCFN